MDDDGLVKVRRALVAVADKSGIAAFGRALVERGVELVSTGNTARTLDDAGVPVTAVAEVTGFPEMLDGRVKTLHPRIHAGILADRRKPEHVRQLEEHGIRPFDLVVVNLYPFRETVAAGAEADEVIEQIDIGGPAMVRAAAKNFESVGIVVDPEAYDEVLRAIDADGGLSRELRRRLARTAFEHTAAYDAAVSAWFAAGSGVGEDLPARFTLARSGRSPGFGTGRTRISGRAVGRGGGRGAARRRGRAAGQGDVVQQLARRRGGARRWRGCSIRRCAVAVIVKHHNPCGVALASLAGGGVRQALACDPVSAFGGIVAFNVALDEAGAGPWPDVFTEVVIAPAFTEGALAAFASGRTCASCGHRSRPRGGWTSARSTAGRSCRTATRSSRRRERHEVVSVARADRGRDGATCCSPGRWRARVKSNAIVLAKDGPTVGVGAGQMNRASTRSRSPFGRRGDRADGAVAGVATRSSRSATAIERPATPGSPPIIQPGGRCATRRSWRRPRSTAWPWCSPAAGTSATEAARR